MSGKTLCDFYIYYWKNKQLNIYIGFRHFKEKTRLQLSLMTIEKLPHSTRHKDEWGIKFIRHWILWKNF